MRLILVSLVIKQISSAVMSKVFGGCLEETNEKFLL